jgi:hypothetical protein
LVWFFLFCIFNPNSIFLFIPFRSFAKASEWRSSSKKKIKSRKIEESKRDKIVSAPKPVARVKKLGGLGMHRRLFMFGCVCCLLVCCLFLFVLLLFFFSPKLKIFKPEETSPSQENIQKQGLVGALNEIPRNMCVVMFPSGRNTIPFQPGQTIRDALER